MKQDWSPREMDLPPDQAIVKLRDHAWWDFIQALKNATPPEDFHRWLLRMARPWWRRAEIIKRMAWNDRNSTWHLELALILHRHRFSDDGGKVTAEAVVESLESMLW